MPNHIHTTTVTVSLPSDKKDELIETAAEARLSPSAFVRRLILDALDALKDSSESELGGEGK